MDAMALLQVEESYTTVKQIANEIEECYAARIKRFAEIFAEETNINMSDGRRKGSGARKFTTYAEEIYGTFASPFQRFSCFEATGRQNDQHTMQIMSDERRTESGANKFSTFAELINGTGRENDQHTMQNMSDERRNESGANKFSTFAELLYGTGRENDQHTMQNMSDERRNESGADKISAFAVQTDDISPNNSSKIKRCIFALCSQFLPCAGGSDLEDSQHQQQAASDIYQHTLSTVSHCPSVSDYMQRATDICAEVCKSNIKDGSCSYHCMRDSYKTSLVEFCAKPKVLFDYCPEYDPIGQTVQKDIYSPCNPIDSLQRFFSSSDLFFCNKVNCLQLREANVTTGVTGLMTETTPVSGDITDYWLSQYWYWLLLGGALILCIGFIAWVRRRFKVFRKGTKKGNPDDVQSKNEQALLHNVA